MPRFKISFSKDCLKQYKALREGNRKVYQKCATLITNLSMGEDPLQPPRPESRIPDAAKWDLGDGYRILGVKSDEGIVFLVAGTHDAVENFIDRYRGTHISKDRRTALSLESPLISDEDLDIDERLPFSQIGPEFFTHFGLEDGASRFLPRLKDVASIDEPAFMQLLSEMPRFLSELLLQYASDKTKREGIHSLVRGEMDAIEGRALVTGIQGLETSEDFVTFSDPDNLHSALSQPPEEWMLFLHPVQRKWAYSTFSGPARLRGIAGSGKTSVAIHRASHLARSMCGPGEKVLFTTFSRPLADVVRKSLQALCGVELSSIDVRNIGQWSSDFIRTKTGPFEFLNDREARESHFLPIYREFRGRLKTERLWQIASPEYMYEEIRYIKSRFADDQVDGYLSMERRGRELKFGSEERKLILAMYRRYQLSIGGHYDPEDVPREAYRRILELPKSHRPTYKAIIIDEVQDFSQIELQMLYSISGRGENQFFMVGDGTQKIYRSRGFSLSSLGIDIGGRATVLKKNYRNTAAIMRAACELVRGAQFEEASEDSFGTAFEPDYSDRNGQRPLIVKFPEITEECNWVVKTTVELLASGKRPEDIAILSSGTSFYRERIQQMLSAESVPVAMHSEELAFVEPKVKISTFESAKGGEFPVVFVVGATEAYLPETPVQNLSKLYVAMSRARDSLFISYSIKDQHGRDVRPSPFLSRFHRLCDFEDKARAGK